MQEEREAVVAADWDDVGAAVLLAAARNEMAVLTHTRPAPDLQVFELVTISDEPARLTARLLAESPVVKIEVRAAVGHFGDTKREDRLVTAVIRRLRALAGVDYRPAR